MTAFAKQDMHESWGSASWELRSVNNRFVDMGFKVPDSMRELEMKCRTLIKKYCARGKVDCHLRLQVNDAELVKLKLNHSMMGELKQILAEMSDELGSTSAINPASLLRFPGLIGSEEGDTSEFKETILQNFEQALKKLLTMREREGEKLSAIILEKLKLMTAEIVSIKPKLAEIVTLHEAKLRERLLEARVEIDEPRLTQEMVYLAQKFDVTEEIERLEIHVCEIDNILNSDENVVGRRLDFLTQELHREANTLSAKSIHDATTQASVKLKVLIEQIREQIQNIE